jgi:histidinol-phosphate phosphatase family protein
MSEHSTYLPSKEALKEFTVFIDRDGVINEPIVDDYARTPDDFDFCQGAIDALAFLKKHCKYLILVTNQQGIHRELMTEQDLQNVHLKMYKSLKNKSIGYFDAVFYAPYLKSENHLWRKPNTGMILKAQTCFQDIDWQKCMMIGDSPTDMQLADNMNITKIRIGNPQFNFDNQDFQFASLKDFVAAL